MLQLKGERAGLGVESGGGGAGDGPRTAAAAEREVVVAPGVDAREDETTVALAY